VHCWWTYEEDDGNRARAADDPDLPAGTYTDLTVDLDSGGCALRDDGAIACWGAEDIPVPKPSGTFISLGDSCGIKDTGEIECFGWAEWYGDGPAPQLPAGPFVRMDGSRFHGCAIRENGALACWGDGGGYDDNGNALPLSTPPGAYTDVTVGEYYACARGSEGRAVCWGENAEAARPAPTVLVADSAFVTGSKVSVSWRATPISAPITGFDVEYTTDEWAEDDAGNEVERHWVSLLTGTNKSSATLEGREGAAYCWRVRARDADGIMSDWTGPYHCTAVPIDERSLKATGAWTPLEGPGYYKGTALKTTTRGATLLISQEGAFGLVILATTCRGCGTFILRYPQQGCWEDEEEEPTPQASCPPDEEQVELRGPRDDSAIAFMGNDGQEGYAGPLELVVTSSGKPVIIDGVIFADTE
jgi:hypothetical protein